MHASEFELAFEEVVSVNFQLNEGVHNVRPKLFLIDDNIFLSGLSIHESKTMKRGGKNMPINQII